MRPPLSLAPRTSCEDQSERWSDSDWLTYPKVTFLYGELTGGGGSTLLLSSRNVCLAQLTAAGNAPWLGTRGYEYPQSSSLSEVFYYIWWLSLVHASILCPCRTSEHLA